MGRQKIEIPMQHKIRDADKNRDIVKAANTRCFIIAPQASSVLDGPVTALAVCSSWKLVAETLVPSWDEFPSASLDRPTSLYWGGEMMHMTPKQNQQN